MSNRDKVHTSYCYFMRILSFLILLFCQYCLKHLSYLLTILKIEKLLCNTLWAGLSETSGPVEEVGFWEMFCYIFTFPVSGFNLVKLVPHKNKLCYK